MQHGDLFAESMKKLARHGWSQSDFRDHEQCVLSERQSGFYGAQ